MAESSNTLKGKHAISVTKVVTKKRSSETWAWDVRNKHVAYEPVPTVDGVIGLANFGPQATMFTLGPNHTVQQYDLSPPALVKNVRHDGTSSQSVNTTPKMIPHSIPGAAPPVPVYKSYDSGRGAASLSTIQRATTEMQAADHARQMRKGMTSPLSTASRTESISSRSSAGIRDRAPSVSSHAASGTTFSTLSPSIIARDSNASPFWPQSASVASSGRRSKGSRLRQEILRSPEGNIVDLFPYTRARLASLPYAPHPPALDPNNASASELRQQMLRIVFGWEGDIEAMIRDEVSRHPPGSMNATLLSKWLGEVNFDMMSMVGSDSVTSTDWMMLALSNMGGQSSAAQHLGRNFVQKLLQQGDIHTAATVLIGLQDLEDAIDIYISRNYYMEGILLTCLLFPDEWQRQAHLVRRWGEYVVENSQQHLAIRCFTCTGTDTSIPWASPTQSPFGGVQSSASLPQTLSPPTSPPPENKPGRMTAKTSTLKLITSFGPNEKGAFRFPGLKTDDRTPTNAPGVTPIAESALSPGGTPSTYLRPTLRAKTPGGHSKSRLPSIGETPIDVNPPLFPISRPNPLPTPDNSGSDKEKEPRLTIITNHESSDSLKMIEDPPLTLSSAKYDPKEDATPHATPQTAIPNSAVRKSYLSNSDMNAMSNAQERSRTRNGSRDRKPTGLHIQMPSLNQLNLNAIATGSHTASPRSGRRKSNSSSLPSSSSASGRFDLKGELTSPPATGQSWTSSAKSPSVSGRSMDAYISSLEEAQFYSQKQKEKHHTQKSREGRPGEQKSRSKGRHRQPSEDRGRTGQRYIRPAKRSPSSPVPMSPEDLQQYREANSKSIDSMVSRDSSPEAGPRVQSTRRKGISSTRSQSKVSDRSHLTVRRLSPGGSKAGSRVGSRRASPDKLLSPIDGRGRSRSKARGGSQIRSPSSPLPMSPQVKLYQSQPDDYIDDDPMRLVEANRQRLRSKQRSSSRKPRERGTSSRRDPSPDRRKLMEERPPLIGDLKRDSPRTSDFERAASDGTTASRLSRTKSHRSLKKEMAARELEARRESLTARTMAAIANPPNISARPQPQYRTQSDMVASNGSIASWMPVGSPEQMYSLSDQSISSAEHLPDRAASVGPVGLPATPRAMRHPRYPSRDEDIPAVPEVPDSFYATGQPMRELPRSMSAPVPEPEVLVPSDMPTHPAFQRGLRSSTKRPNFSPLGEIGRQRRSPSIDASGNPPVLASIGETLQGISEAPIIDVPTSSHAPPTIIPELQHLASSIPPPPPPPPPPPFRDDAAHHSLSSGSGVGTINIVMEDTPTNGSPVIEVGPRPPTKDSARVASPPLPPLPLSGKHSPPHSGNSISSANSNNPLPTSAGPGHKRGRSIEHFGSKITRMADRMRSTSRGRNNARSPPIPNVPSPYETRLEAQPVSVGVGSQGNAQYF